MKKTTAEIFELSDEIAGGYVVTFDRDRRDPIPPDDLYDKLHTAKDVANKIVTKLVTNKLMGDHNG